MDPIQVQLKTCTGCGESKPATREFWTRNQGGKAGWRSQCKICTNVKGRVRSKRWGKKWHHGRRNSWLRRMYGITTSDYDRMLKEQEGRCGLCRSEDPKRAGQLYFSVDHCHTTGKVRGLLCVTCNSLVGILERSGNWSLLAFEAVAYIKAARYLPMPRPSDAANDLRVLEAEERATSGPKHPVGCCCLTCRQKVM